MDTPQYKTCKKSHLQQRWFELAHFTLHLNGPEKLTQLWNLSCGDSHLQLEVTTCQIAITFSTELSNRVQKTSIHSNLWIMLLICNTRWKGSAPPVMRH